jgi:tripartite-type tricarboxylate transporter receptor subunit TctC
MLTAAVTAAVVLLPAHASAQASDFFKGKTVTLYVGTPVGGGFDLYGRLVARHIGRHLPGDPTVVVSNMPGAAGIICANFMYGVAPKDGTAIAILQQNMAEVQALGTESVRFDVARFNWIGRVASNVELAYTWHRSATKTIEDAQRRETVMATTGPNTLTYPLLLNKLIGTRFKLVRGYVGTRNAQLALQRGEVDGMSGSYDTLKTGTDWLTTGKVNVLVQYERHRHPSLRQVRSVAELVGNSEDQALFAFLAQGSEIGRSLLAPPGVASEHVEALRAAFDATMTDSQFLAELKQAQAEYDPLPGRELQHLIERRMELTPTNKKRVQMARSD